MMLFNLLKDSISKRASGEVYFVLTTLFVFPSCFKMHNCPQKVVLSYVHGLMMSKRHQHTTIASLELLHSGIPKVTSRSGVQLVYIVICGFMFP